AGASSLVPSQRTAASVATTTAETTPTATRRPCKRLRLVRLRRRVRPGARLELERLVRSEDLLLQPAARLGAGHRVEQHADGDADEQEQEVPPPVRLLAAGTPAPRTELVERVAELVLDVLVARDLHRDRSRAGRGDQVVVDLPCGLVRLLHV